MSVVMLDCTLRDGGYYNSWDFEQDLVQRYLHAMAAARVDYVELGLRGFARPGFFGPYAFSRDDHLKDLGLPKELRYGVMVNAAELLKHADGPNAAVKLLFGPAAESPIELVRVACHLREVSGVLEACRWLKTQGYRIGLNIMQIAECSVDDLVSHVSVIPVDVVEVLYFADSTGGMSPAQVSTVVASLRQHWAGALGIHAHDNRALAHANTLQAISDGVTWVDSTVTGMGRGPGNAKTEYLVLEFAEQRVDANTAPLLKLVSQDFLPMQQVFGWGTNSYYYIAGKYGIHPTYVQEMLGDSRYSGADLATTLEALKDQGARTFSSDTLEAARHFYYGEISGSWAPRDTLSGREALLIGAGPGVVRHRRALERYIRQRNPVVVALNTQSRLDDAVVDLRIACHPLRLMADLRDYAGLRQPLITPASMLPSGLRDALGDLTLLDFGISVCPGTFEFAESHCTVPNTLALSYALALLASGGVSRILLAGFDGYASEDPRNHELDQTLELFQAQPGVPELLAITPTRLQLPISSVYAL
ncbi:aldolase catalytic domain-containing protein [Pseudomonas sp. BMS12]|uniref:aldolase catalytic domain-containing protein n=1 Tax=Pseudomonas sp. BMS12 TaxID=1796033 RepID=UPI000ADD74F8|nr:aldolase catalytic domain-containing protein [Pseudomonas sp. BMS12]